MKPLVSILLIINTLSEICVAQNLIQNGSFENILQCPTFGSHGLQIAPPWINPNKATPDVFNECALTAFFGVPENYVGFEYAHSGVGYSIIGASGPFMSPYYEYVTTPIALKTGAFYRIEFYLSLCEKSGFMTDEISFHLSSELLDSNSFSFIGLSPTHSISNNWLNKNDGWQLVQLDFMGNSQFNYLTIGFFKAFHEMNVLPFDVTSDGIIYFIDDVQLYPLDYHPQLTDTSLCSRDNLFLEAPYYPDMSYAWYFGNQWLSDSSTLYYDNPEEGWYVLHYTDFRGDTYQDSVYVTVEICPELWLPTWFAPSQSLYWHPQWRDIEYWEVTVYNSLGQMVHRYTGTPEQHSGWDGSSIATGVYHAVVNARAFNGEQLRVVEKVMVLR